ncbi:Formate dehydrogenase, cytochrome b556(Fdo) subunit OS=Streptomyces griseorubiginosus OX=67304 GN=fdoI PE=4 SV=1 [Streptomyces griseorubiginosus]
MRSTAGSTGPTGRVTRPEREGRIRRFSTAERMVHRVTGYLMLLCLVTAACLYLGPTCTTRRAAAPDGHRPRVVRHHTARAVPARASLSPAFRADLRRLNRFAVYDRQWLRAVRRRRTSPEARPAGKFNAGQKLYAGWIAGAVLVMMFTGLLMWFMGLLPFISRTSAILVHDILAWAITFVVLGHLRKAFEDPEARLGMRTGHVSLSWAQRHHSRWLREEREGDAAADAVDRRMT